MRKPPPEAIDRIDRKLLALLQTDARLTQEKLAEQIGLSASAVQRRIRRLEQIGVIEGYRAIVSPRALGLSLSALLSVRLEKHRASNQRQRCRPPPEACTVEIVGFMAAGLMAPTSN